MQACQAQMRRITSEYRECFSDRAYLWSFFLSLLMLVASTIVSFYAITYATSHASNGVSDIILSNIRVYDVDGIFVFGSIVLGAVIALVCLVNPRKIPFILKSIALFVLIRSAFVTLTHIGPFPGHNTIDASTQVSVQKWIGADLFFTLFSGNDFFFSGHTGLSFLMALMFWKEKWMRALFVAAAVFFGVIALLGHLHYTIDIVAAFFITYTIYCIAIVFFKRDFASMTDKALPLE